MSNPNRARWTTGLTRSKKSWKWRRPNRPKAQRKLRMKRLVLNSCSECEYFVIENLRSIEGVAQPPAGISVKETYKVSQGELTAPKAEVPRTKRKFVPGRTADSKRRERPVEARPASQNQAAITSAPPNVFVLAVYSSVIIKPLSTGHAASGYSNTRLANTASWINARLD